MSALDRLLVDAAVAVSPAAHRTARREQWAADVRDAHELDLSPTALAFGALTTALFHRRAGHRSTWGESMTAPPLDVRPAPHTIRTVPVLVAVALLSLVAAGAWLILQPNSGYESESDRIVGTAGLWTLVFVVPGTAMTLAALALRTPIGRRRVGASMLAAATVTGVLAPLTTVTAAFPIPTIPLFLALAGWLVAVRARGWTWSLALLPVLVLALDWSGTLYQFLPLRWSPFIVGMPAMSVIAAGAIASRFSTDAPTRVEQHPEALVDKSA